MSGIWNKDAGEGFTSDLNQLSWFVGDEGSLGPGYMSTDSAENRNIIRAAPLSSATSWANIDTFGAVTQVVTDDTYVTVADITSGSGSLINIFLPGVTTSGDTASVRITIDGYEKVLTFTATNATDRIIAGDVKTHNGTYIVYGERDYNNSNWSGGELVSGLAFRLSGEVTVTHLISNPGETFARCRCLRYFNSLKIEMKSSDVSTTTYRDYCGAVYRIDQ